MEFLHKNVRIRILTVLYMYIIEIAMYWRRPTFTVNTKLITTFDLA